MKGKASIKLIDGSFFLLLLGHWSDTGRAGKSKACETIVMTKAVTRLEIAACNRAPAMSVFAHSYQ